MLKLYFFVLLFVLAGGGCKRSGDIVDVNRQDSGVEGQLYANAGPGFHSVRTVATIVVLRSDTSTHVTEVKSDTNGTFKISLTPGNYILYVKESHDRCYSGPFEVVVGSYTESKAYLYDSRIV